METQRTRPRRASVLVKSILGVAAIGVAFFGWRVFGSNKPLPGAGSALGPSGPGQIRYEVKRQDLTISALSAGELKTKSTTQIVNQVDRGLNILWIIEEGTRVKKGDKLVELDHSELDELLLKQKIRMSDVRQTLQAAMDDLAIAESKAATDLLAAENKVHIAELDLKKYLEGDFEQSKRKAESAVAIAQEELKRAKDRLEWTKKLAEKDYVTQNDLEADKFAVTKGEINLVSAQEDLGLLMRFTKERETTRLQTAMREAQGDLERVRLTGQRDIATRKAAVQAAKNTTELEEYQLNDLNQKVAMCVINAPQDGMVVYAKDRYRDSGAQMQVGTTVSSRQRILDLPDFTAWKVEARVHESQIQRIRQGQPAFVTIDAFPERALKGSVSRISVLPDNSQWYRDTQEYIVDIELGDKMAAFKPGMSSKAEIILAELRDVIAVPVQAIQSRGGKTMVWIAGETGPALQEVKVGQDNGRFVEIAEGLAEGQVVLLDQSAPQGTGLATRPAEQATPEARTEAGEAAKNLGKKTKKENAPPAPVGDAAPAAPKAEGPQSKEIGAPAAPPHGEGEAPAAEGSAPRGERRRAEMTDEQRAKMREEYEKMSPEEREAAKKQWQERQGGGERQGNAGGR